MSADSSRTQARRMTETAYMAASTGLLWVAIYYLPIGDALFRLAIPLPLALLQLRQGGRTAVEVKLGLALPLGGRRGEDSDRDDEQDLVPVQEISCVRDVQQGDR